MVKYFESHEFYDLVRRGQLKRLERILVGGLIVCLIGFIWPNFFQYQYLFLPNNFWTVVMSYWPAYAWATGFSLFMAVIGGYKTTGSDEAFLWRGVTSSIGAGVTEEGWYRGVSVFFAVIGLIILNFILGAVGWLFVGLSGLAIVFAVIYLVVHALRGEVTLTLVFLTVLGVAGLTGLIWGLLTYNHDPLYNIYEHLFYPIIDFATLGLMEKVWTGDHQPILLMGMFAANFTFRDKHKYLGLVGWTNSWFLGCVFIYATLTHGLWTAMAVHALYDIVLDVWMYLGRRFNGR